jgi:hypothetical protein
VLQLSGGRDSRLLLAAAIAGDVDVDVISTGEPELSDVQIARRICSTVGVKHRLQPRNPGPDVGVRETARRLRLTSGGGISLEDADGYFTPADGAMPLWLNGQGGEISRAYYGNGNGLDRAALVHRLFELAVKSGDLLTPQGRQLVERDIGLAVDTALASGVAPGDVPDVFYLERRMAHWAATGHGCVEYAKGDTICPLWSRRLLPHQLGASADDRAGERWPQATLEVISPQLARIPYAERPPPRPLGSDGFATFHHEVADVVAEQPSLDVWEVLDRTRVQRLLASDPGSLDRRQRRPVWRLATAFLGLQPSRPRTE